ncbi:MAG: S8 family serine peptidase [Microbacteriaceae bacterium]|uniref:S8 family serine peptidase n=1 Tax=Microbacterium sp. TaxID=51671 RepID=UPI003F9CDF3C
MPSRRHRALRALLGSTAAIALALTLGAPAANGIPLTGPANQPARDAEIAPQLQAAVLGASAPDGSGAGTDADASDAIASSDEAIEILVLFEDDGVDPIAQGDPERAASALQDSARISWDAAQQGLAEMQEDGRVDILNEFWITRSILVSAEPSLDVLDALAALPGATQVVPNFEVEPLTSEEPVPLSTPSVATAALDETGTPVTYGLEKIGAPQSWIDFAARGQGVRVAVLDTGIDASHPDLSGRIVGAGLGDPTFPGGWISFDRTGSPIASRPSDPGSHGTHVAGTVLGGSASGTRIGVAPDAELMAANVLSGSGGGSIAKILAGMQWAMQPFDAYGNPAGRAADVVNMSLGSSGYSEIFIPLVRNLRQAGIFPAIAIGNAPCGPTGTSGPGDIYEAFGVGMTNAADEVDPGSCGGVTEWPAQIGDKYDWPQNFVKPDASAPGTAVFSAMPNGRWGESTGTSMATPHVAGAVALIRSAQGGLSVDQIAEALESTAWHPDGASAPDTGYGHGRIDVHAAIAAVLGQSGVNGTVTDAATGAAVPGATISFDDRGETWTTDEQGRFTARLAPGTYTFTAERFGYAALVSAPITIDESGFVRIDLAMTPITVGSIGGIVVDALEGTPIVGASVQVVGQELTATTGADGGYRIADLPVGSYRIRVSAPGYADAVSADAEVRAALQTTVNYRLAELQQVLVLGDNGARTAELLNQNGYAATSAPSLPDDLEVSDYDVLVWDAPPSMSDEQLRDAIDRADAGGVGMVWLDQGSTADSGIAQLQRATGNPAVRSGANDRSLLSTGYRVLADHEIFAGGELSSEAFATGDVIGQNTVAGGPKYYAWFEDLTGEGVQVLAETVTVAASGTAEDADVTTAVGSGIAVVQRAGSRHVLLALHGSSPAVDVRTWSLASTQVFMNAVTWTAPEHAQAPAPEIIVPEPPVIEPGKPGGGGSATPRPSPAEPTPAPALAPAPAAQDPASRAPATQIAPKPNTVPDPPFASAESLTAANRGSITARIESGIAHVVIPDAEPGEWFFLHVYPSKTPIDWIRVNDDGELLIDIARLQGGTYAFAFTDAEGEFAGWVEIVIAAGAAAAQEAPVSNTEEDEITVASISTPGLSLSPVEQLMLLGAGLLILAAAALVLLSAKRRPGAVS